MSAPALTKPYWEAVHSAAARVIGVLFRPSSRRENQFSAVLIRYGSRRFIATAQHCVEHLGDKEPLLLSTPTAPRGTPVDWVARYHFPQVRGRDADAAILEVTRKWADARNADWADADEAGSRNARARRRVLLVGFPLEKTRRSPDKVVAGAFAVVTEVAAFPRGKQSDGPKMDPRVDVFLQFPEGRFRDQHGSKVLGMDPRGMSGCPVFLVPGIPKSGIWAPRLRLVAIQSGWIKGWGLLRAKRIEYVVKLIQGVQPT